MKKSIIFALLIMLAATSMFAQDKFGAKVYFDYTYDKDGSPTNEFEIHRAYFTYQNKLSDVLSYKFTTDVGRTGADDRQVAYLKVAQLKWKTGAGDLVFGLQGMNVFKIQEGNWGYRFIEKSPMDQYKFSSSADLGLGYYNKLGDKVHFSVLITNGRGYKKSENDNYKKISGQIYYGDSKIGADGNFNFGAIFSQESYDYTAGTETTTESKVVFGGFGVYQFQTLKIGAEYDMYSIGGSDISKNIISAYANFGIKKGLDVFARVDMYDPNKDNDGDATTNVIAGLNYVPGKGFNIAPNIRIYSPETGDAVTIYKLNFQFKI